MWEHPIKIGDVVKIISFRQILPDMTDVLEEFGLSLTDKYIVRHINTFENQNTFPSVYLRSMDGVDIEYGFSEKRLEIICDCMDCSVYGEPTH